MTVIIGRRELLVALLGGAAVAWPLAARAQQGERVRRIGLLQGLAESDPETQARTVAFRQALEALDGRKAAISTSTIDLPAAIPLASRHTRSNW